MPPRVFTDATYGVREGQDPPRCRHCGGSLQDRLAIHPRIHPDTGPLCYPCYDAWRGGDKYQKLIVSFPTTDEHPYRTGGQVEDLGPRVRRLEEDNKRLRGLAEHYRKLFRLLFYILVLMLGVLVIFFIILKRGR